MLTYYWINLDNAVDRRKECIQVFNEEKIKNKRVPAILGGSSKKSKENACVLSHLKAITTVCYDKNEWAIICEDDISFELKPYWKKNINEIINHAPKNAGIIQLSITSPNVFDLINRKEYFPHKDYPTYSCVCYAIRISATKELIQHYCHLLKNKISIERADHKNEGLFRSLDNHTKWTSYTYKYPPYHISR